MKNSIKFFFIAIGLILMGFKTSDKIHRIVFAGDSITDGAWGGSNGTKIPTARRNHSDLNHIFGHSYMMLSASRLMADYPEEGFVFYNRGISGNTLADLENRWQDDILSLHPDLISVLIGTNDIHSYLAGKNTEEFGFEEWEKRFRKLLDMAIECNPDIRFIICTPFTAKSGEPGKRDDFEKRREITNRLALILKKIADDYNANLIRYDELFEDIENRYNDLPTEYWIWDGIHPTPAGHQIMSDAWIKTFKELKAISD